MIVMAWNVHMTTVAFHFNSIRTSITFCDVVTFLDHFHAMLTRDLCFIILRRFQIILASFTRQAATVSCFILCEEEDACQYRKDLDSVLYFGIPDLGYKVARVKHKRALVFKRKASTLYVWTDRVVNIHS